MKILKSLIIILCALTLQTCKPGHLDGDASPCHDFKTSNFEMQDVYRWQIMPYKGNEILRFLKNGTDTLTFEGKGLDSGYSCYDYVYAPVCPPDNYCYRYFKYRFIETGGKDSIVLYKYQEGTISRTSGRWSGVFNVHAVGSKLNSQLQDIGTFPIDSTFLNTGYISLTKFALDVPDSSYLYIGRQSGIVHIKIKKDYYTLIP